MPFFQNPFDQTFKGSWILNDQTYVLSFDVAANVNRSDLMMCWANAPYDLSSETNLTLNFAIDREFKNYTTITINIAGSTPAQTTAAEVAAALNANGVFSTFFTATAEIVRVGNNNRVLIRSTKPNVAIRAYISNSGAESVLLFNQKAGVNELPTYFYRHDIDERFNFTDSLAALIELDPGDPIDAAIITAAGFDPGSPKDDWELLTGRSTLFMFRKITVDGSNRATEIIEYPAGAGVGYLARKIEYVYTGANTTPDQITEIPYTLTSGDLITP